MNSNYHLMSDLFIRLQFHALCDLNLHIENKTGVKMQHANDNTLSTEELFKMNKVVIDLIYAYESASATDSNYHMMYDMFLRLQFHVLCDLNMYIKDIVCQQMQQANDHRCSTEELCKLNIFIVDLINAFESVSK